jgi:hypothetical protein
MFNVDETGPPSTTRSLQLRPSVNKMLNKHYCSLLLHIFIVKTIQVHVFITCFVLSVLQYVLQEVKKG